MLTRVKICGLTNAADALLAAELGAHAVGFVFADSPRRADPAIVAEIVEQLPPFVTSVGVFVNESPERIREVVRLCRLDTVQLHGDETPEYLAQLGSVKVIRGIRLRGEADLAQVESWPQDTVLIEPFCPEVRGGSGRQLDLDLARRATKCGKRIILAGGLTPDNVGEAVHRVRPYAVDTSSGVEAEPGRKDPDKLRRFLQSVREADAVLT